MKLKRLICVLGFAAMLVSSCGNSSVPGAAAPESGAVFSSSSGDTAREIVNGIRAKANQPALTRNATLDRVARAHAQDMAARNFFSHTGSNGSNVAQRVKRAGYRWCFVAENITKGYMSDSAAIESWRVSPGHYRNLVAPKSREFGFAHAGKYRVMVLASKRC